jgi:hypothetical protein
MPSNASKEWSGTKTDLKKKAKKIDRAVRFLLGKHREEDKKGAPDPDVRQREEKQKETLRQASRKIKDFLAKNEDRKGRSGNVVQSNVTDNDSAKMKTSHGVIQGYTGVAAVDSKHQVVVAAEAFGTGQEHGLLEPMIEAVCESFNGERFKEGDEILKQAKVLADSGYHSGDTLDYLEENGIDGYVADKGFRARDPRFATASRHKANEPPKPKTAKTLFAAEDFTADIEKQTCICPAGKSMWLKCARARIHNHVFMQFQGHLADCDGCALRLKCLRNPKPKAARQVHILLGRANTEKARNNPIERMKQKIDSALGRDLYGQRLGIVEPVFGNLREILGLRRFSLRGKKKVDTQWKLMTMVHNIFKIHRYGWAL